MTKDKLSKAQYIILCTAYVHRKAVVSGRSWRSVSRLVSLGYANQRSRYVAGASPGLTGREEITVTLTPRGKAKARGEAS